MKVVRFVMLSLFALLLVSCSTDKVPNVSEVTSPTPTLLVAPTPSPSPSSDHRKELTIEKSSKFPGIDIVSDIDWQADYHHAVHYPRIAEVGIDQAIRAMMDKRIESYMTKIKDEEVTIEEERVPELLIDYDIKYVSDQFISILFTETSYFGGAHPGVESFSVNISLQEHKILTLSDLFLPNSNYLQQLSKLSREGLKQSRELGEYYDRAWVDEGTLPEEKLFKTFILTDHEFIVYFDMYQVAARAAGPQMVSIPYAQLNDILKAGRVPYEPIVTTAPDVSPTPEATIEPSTKPQPTGGKENSKRKIALTFDDGPHKKVTPAILDVLKEKNGKATFFVLGNRVEYYPDIMQRIVDEGHEIGNHSWNHSELTRLSKKEIKEQFTKTQQAVFDAVGVWPSSIRPPYGAYDDNVKALAELPLVLWSVDTLDWKHRDKKKVVQAAISGAKDGGIILFHDMYTTTADALGTIMDRLAADGYEFVTVSELLEFKDDAQPVAGKVFHSTASLKKKE